MLATETIEAHNEKHSGNHQSALAAVGNLLSSRGQDIETIIGAVARFQCAIPSWALGTGGTRFGRFPGKGEPRNVFEKMEDIAVIHQLTGSAPTVSLHIPWDEPDDPAELRDHAAALGLGFDAVNSNTFQDQPDQPVSYKFGSLCHTDVAVRDYAIEHNLHTIEIGKALGSKSITVWLADGSNFPGQSHLRKAYERTLHSLAQIYSALPSDWLMFTEHKPFEPAFYSTVVQDWGTSLMLAQSLGPQAKCLVDLGHHLPNCNVEQIVARLVTAGKLGGFHFNDSMYGDDDLTTGSIHPFQLFLVFNELVDAALMHSDRFEPSYMLDQSHNLKDPIEALIQSLLALQRAFAKAQLVDRKALAEYQESNDVLMAEETLRTAYETDVAPVIAEARLRNGAALAPLTLFRESLYRAGLAEARASAGAYVPPQSL
jgi:L-rhamnose isomerase/sugar isomerase